MKKRRKTIVCFSAEAGIAHVTRTLAVACELKERGHRVIFAIAPHKQAFVRSAGIAVVDAPIALEEGVWTGDSVRRWKDPEAMTRLATADRDILASLHPDGVIVDFRPSAVAAARSLALPMVFLTGSGGLPYGSLLPNPGYHPFLHNFFQPFLQRLIWQAKLPYYRAMFIAACRLGYGGDIDRFLHAIRFIVPEIPDYLPACDKTLSICYTGPLFWEGFEKHVPSWLSQIKPNGKTVYLSFGGTGYDGQKLVDVATQLVANGFRVLVSASTIAPVSAFPIHPALFVAGHLPGMRVCRRVDLVVCHGGYGTMMQAFIAGVPVLAIPFNPDQLLHGWRVAELGLGTCLVRPRLADMIPSRLLTDNRIGSRVATEDIVKVAQRMFLERETYMSAINRFRRQISSPAHALAAAANSVERIIEEGI